MLNVRNGGECKTTGIYVVSKDYSSSFESFSSKLIEDVLLLLRDNHVLIVHSSFLGKTDIQRAYFFFGYVEGLKRSGGMKFKDLKLKRRCEVSNPEMDLFFYS